MIVAGRDRSPAVRIAEVAARADGREGFVELNFEFESQPPHRLLGLFGEPTDDPALQPLSRYLALFFLAPLPLELALAIGWKE